MIYNAPLNEKEIVNTEGFVFCNICHRMLAFVRIFEYNEEIESEYEYAVLTHIHPLKHGANAHFDFVHQNSEDWFKERAYYVKYL